MRELTVDLGERSYPIYIGEGMIGRLAEFLGTNGIQTASSLLVVTDSGVAPHLLDPVMAALAEGGYQAESVIVPAGEKSKSLAVLEDIVTVALKAGLDRKSTVIALGGGVYLAL